MNERPATSAPPRRRPRPSFPVVALALALVLGCAAAPPPPPAPLTALPPPPPAPAAAAPPAPSEVTPPPAAADPVPPAADPPPADPAPADPPAPRIGLAIEEPFRLDRRVFPQDKAAFLADLADRTRWNQGGLGELAAPLPPVPGHPAPKVIVDVPRARGPRAAADVQRELRRLFWIHVVGCYGEGAWDHPTLRGAAYLSASVSAEGKIVSSSVTSTTFRDDVVPRCLAEHVQRIALPRAKGPSQIAVDVHVGPGDEPMPPPQDLVVPGDGEIAPAAVRAVIEAARPAFEACYAPALAYAPALWGRLGVRFHVTERGRTDEAFEVESRFPDERVTLCVLRAARKLKFPKPAGGDVRFVVPLRFWSGESPVAGAGAGAAKM
jgi:hypothetical protein